MSASRKPRNVLPRRAGSKVLADFSAPIDGASLAEEIEARVKIARDLDPREPRKKQLMRKMACAWLAEKGVDLGALGLPLEPDRDPDPAESRPPGVLTLKVTPAPGAPEKGFKNAEAEEGLLAGMMSLPEVAAQALDLVGPEDFSYPQFRVIARAVKDLCEAGRNHDAAHVIQELGGSAKLDLAYGQETICSIASKPVTAGQALSYAAIVRENSDQRLAAAAIDGLKQAMAKGEKSTIEVVAATRELLDRFGGRRDEADPLKGSRRWPAPPAPAVWHGPAGELAELVEPHTEADPVAILSQFLVCVGSMIGRKAHWVVGGERHYCNLYLMLAGHTGDGRKGTAMRAVEQLTRGMGGKWWKDCVHKGMSSGEGFMEVIRDPSRFGKAPHPGTKNKTALWVEPEFGSTLEQMNREGNSLAGKLRDAWDGNDLATATKSDPMRVTAPYVSVVAHITFSDIHQSLSKNSMQNGFANRFLVVCTRRSRDLPHGADLQSLDWKPLRRAIVEAIAFGADDLHARIPFRFDARAHDLWTAVYPELMRLRHESIAAMAQRCAPMVRRVAVIYAVLDRSPVVTEAHLLAALELWRYSERSLSFTFGGEKPKADDTEQVHAEIRKAGENGIGRYDINRNLFGGRNKDGVAQSLRSLLARGLIDEEIVKKGPNEYPVYRSSAMSRAARPARSSRSEDATNCGEIG